MCDNTYPRALASGTPLDTATTRSQALKITALIRSRGRFRATNAELNTIGFRYGSRLHCLRRQGFKIATQRVRGGEFRHVLLGERQPASTGPELTPQPTHERSGDPRTLSLFPISNRSEK